MSFYAVARGRKVGIFDSWTECENQVKGFKGAKYKKFPTRCEAEAYIKGPTDSIQKSQTQFNPQNVALPLGKKCASDWKANEANEAKSAEKAHTDDFWPENDKSLNDNEAIEADLLAALAEVEGAPINSESNSIKANHNLKRKFKDATNASRSKIPKHASKVWEPIGIKRIGKFDFEIDEEGYVIVYTDGSCFGNGTANACAGYGVYFGENHSLNAAEPVHGRVTNNVGEIQAAIHAIKSANLMGIQKLCISTDSQFLINAITSWVGGWKRKNWRLKNGDPVKNVDDFKELDKLLVESNIIVKWNYVKAHKGIKGNEMADKLAREGSKLYKEKHS